MTTMPTIDDDMVALFRRTGKRRASYQADRNGGWARGATRVALQRSPGCSFFGQRCFNRDGEPGRCDKNLDCILEWNPGPNPFQL